MSDTSSERLAGEMRGLLANVAASVAIISARDANGPAAITATAVTPVALAPPTLLVCINRASRIVGIIESTAGFRVNYLAWGQQSFARAFGRSGGERRFEPQAWSLDADRGPGLHGAQAQFACRLERVIDHGTHAVLIGAVCETGGEGGESLVYVSKHYCRASSATS